MANSNFFNHDFSSVLGQLRLQGDTASSSLAKLLMVAPPAHDAAGLTHACVGAARAVLAAVEFLAQPNDAALLIKDGILALQTRVDSIASSPLATELSAPRGRRLAKFPGWKMLIALAQEGAAQPCLIAGGLLFMRAWHLEGKISYAQAQSIARESQRCELSPEGLRDLLDSNIDAADTAYPWLVQLQRLWPQLLNLLTTDQRPPTQPTFMQRARGQLIGAAEYPSIAHRAGTADHRHLSDRQFRLACQQIADWHTADDWRGVYAETGALTRLTADILGSIPLASSTLASWIVMIDVDHGYVQTDCECLVPAAAVPQHRGVLPSSYIRTASYSLAAAIILRKRRALHPDARTLADLFPEAAQLRGDMPLFEAKDEIRPSWSRWINSFGMQMIRHGHDKLHAATLSCDFGLIARSKLYYASLPKEELWNATNQFYNQIGWQGAEPDTSERIAFGCRVVPTWQAVRAAAEHQLLALEQVRPGKHVGLAKLLEFHNRYVRTVGLRLAALLGLREDKCYDLWADIDERHDLWTDLLDKSVPGAPGALPVALSEYVRKLIHLFRVHCSSMAWRLQTLVHRDTPLHLWLLAVVERERVHLLCTATAVNRIQPIGSADAVGSLPEECALVPDFGRKLLENQMRRLTSRPIESATPLALSTGDIDATLRHEVLAPIQI